MSGLFERLTQRALGNGFDISPVRSPVFAFDDSVDETGNREASVKQAVEQKLVDGEPTAAPVPPESATRNGCEELPGLGEKPSQRWEGLEPDPADPDSGHHHVETMPGPPVVEIRPDAVDSRRSPVPREAPDVPEAPIFEPVSHPVTTAERNSEKAIRERNEAEPERVDHSTRPVVYVPSVTHVHNSPASSAAVVPDQSPLRAAYSETAQAEPAQFQEAQQAPAIQVIIGRVEVRAVAASSKTGPARKTGRPAPRLTLNDYLQQRSSGQR